MGPKSEGRLIGRGHARVNRARPHILVIPAVAAERRRAGISLSPVVKADPGRLRCAGLRDDTKKECRSFVPYRGQGRMLWKPPSIGSMAPVTQRDSSLAK